jgi:ferredoxin
MTVNTNILSREASLPIRLATDKNLQQDKNKLQKMMHVLRHFHLGNPSAVEQLGALSDDYLPALLSTYRDASQLRYDYPLYLSAEKLLSVEGILTKKPVALAQNPLARPLSVFLTETLAEFAPNQDSAVILKDNLSWIERYLREAASQVEGPVAIKLLLQEACEALTDHLQLDRGNQQRLQADLDKLLEQVSDQGLLLAYGRFPALHLLMHLIRSTVIPKLALFKQETEQYIQKLDLLLEIDKSKQLAAKSASSLKSNISSNQFFNTESLSNVVTHSSGSVSMPDTRRQRIEEALAVLQEFKEQEILVHIIHANDSLDQLLNKNSCFATEQHKEPCLRAMEVFDQEAQRLAKVFAATRIAQLEINHLYDEAIHDPWFNNFNWEAFSSQELTLVPSVIVLESAERLASDSMVSFSHLLNSGRPVNILARVQAHNNPGIGHDSDPFQSYRTELGYFGISHRQAVVSQSSAARHEHLLGHFRTALEATRTSLHLINVGIREQQDVLDLNAWLVAGAALEGRAHPFFSVNPSAGDSAADRVDFSGNPQAEKDWPIQLFIFQQESGEVTELELAFTFADYALLIPQLNHHFALVPENFDSDDLLPIADYLALPLMEVDHFIPYVWAVNQQQVLDKLIVSSALVHACRDRLNFWHSLQEMAGVRSRYIEQAELRIQADAETQVAIQVAQAKAEFDAELQRVKTETASEVMSRLTDMLLGMDFSSGSAVARHKMTPSNEVITEVGVLETDSHAIAEIMDETIAEEEESFADPWIDSPLCTTCNDCTDMNPLMFVYNDSNQAFIADLTAGTYMQMVEAAEICPSKCIHPGQPWNNDETDLDELVERAKAFN